MYVACSTLCFASLPFEEAMKTIREFRFHKIDLNIHPKGPHLTTAEVMANPTLVAQRIRASSVMVAAIYLTTTDLTDDVGLAELKATCRLARLLSVPTITVPAAPEGTDMETEVKRLKAWLKVAVADGIIFSVETAAGTLTADPVMALELCRKVPGLGITLDPSHYHNQPTGPANYDPLFPYVRHVRLRDTGRLPGQYQVMVGQGDVEYGRIVTHLDQNNYNRALTVDVRDTPASPFPVDPEVRKLKYLLESLV